MGFLNSLFSGLQNAFGGAMNSIGGAGQSIGQGLGGMFGGNQGGGMSIGGGKSTYGAGNVPKGFPANAAGNSSAGINPGMMGLGAGMMALPQMFSKQQKAPDFNTPDMQAMRNFTTNPPALPQGMQDSINKSMAIQEEQENRNLMNTYESAKPGFDAATDSAYQRDLANLQRNQQSNRANAIMGPTLQYQQPLQQGLQGMAGASQENQYMQAAMKAAQEQQMKNMWSGMGSSFLNKGLFPNGGMGGLGNLFNIGKGNT